MAFCRTSNLLLAILCVLRVQRGGSIDASLQPLDPVIRVGGSLTLSCTLNHGDNNNRTSQSIQWTKHSSRIPASQYATPNVSTSLLHLHNVTIADAGKYYCQFEDDDEWTGKAGVQVFIGTPPEPVKNVTCEAQTLTTFWCKWDNHHHPNTNLAVRDTLQFRPYFGQWRTCRQTEQNRCEGICGDCYEMFETRVISTNVLGNASLHEQFILNEILRPDPVRDVSMTALEPGCLTVTWQLPEGWDGGLLFFLTNSIRYRDLHHPTLHSQWTEVNLTSKGKNYSLCQLRSYATYEVVISIWSILNERFKLKSWSKPVTARTQMTAPSAAPRNLTLNSSLETPTWISVTWSPMDALEENGVVLEYLIYSCTLNASYPQTFVEESVRSSNDYVEWTSLFCLDETRVENMNITQEEDQYDLIEYTLIDSEAGQSYLVWVSAVNFVGEGPLTEPGMIALPSIPERSKRRGRTGAIIASAITICQVIFIIGLCLCCWQAGMDPFKRNRRLPQPYIPPDVLAMKQEALTPRPPCTGEFFNELCEYKEDKSLLEDQSQLAPTMVSNSGGSSVDHGFYDMQSSSSNSGSGSSSCSSSQYNSSHYHSISTLSCSVNLTGNKQIVLMKDPETGYSIATSVTDKCDVPSENDNTQPLLIMNGNYGIAEEEEEEDEDSEGYVNPNDVEPGTVGVSRIILKGNVYNKPSTRHRYQSSQSDTSTVLTSLSDQGFGSADSDPDSRQVSPTETTSPLFPELLPSKQDIMDSNVDTNDNADYFGLDEIESICSSMASSRYRSSNGEDFPYRLPSVTQYRRKSKSSNKSSGSESDIFSGYMSMATKEESDNDYGYVSKDRESGAREGDETAYVSNQEKVNAISTYDMSEFGSEAHPPVNKTMRTEPFSNSSSGDIIRGENRQSPICITIPKTSSPSSSGSSPCPSVASSPNSIVSEMPSVLADRQILMARDFEEEGIPSDLIRAGPALHPDSSDDHPGEGECGGKKDGYVSHVEATKMSATKMSVIQSRRLPETIKSKETPPGSSSRLHTVDNHPKKASLRDILFTDPVSGYVSNAVFT
ncbi:uncharacterized protein LOC115919021 [Strongylocentrotus purpuratus]|uniref:Uncharacterized protein n=1 Tax=Strongylocentrotus purpuratus TaxID=7668 RepID=A0A7M7PLK0_STRPU|nr:uncharacterized protein LOC115919021 [Strongylocentrotus purpuratus]